MRERERQRYIQTDRTERERQRYIQTDRKEREAKIHTNR